MLNPNFEYMHALLCSSTPYTMSQDFACKKSVLFFSSSHSSIAHSYHGKKSFTPHPHLIRHPTHSGAMNEIGYIAHMYIFTCIHCSMQNY